MSSTSTATTTVTSTVKPNCDVLDDDDDDVPQLSAHALAALHDFYEDQREIAEALEKARLLQEEEENNKSSILFRTDLGKFFPEDWQLSQFWYDEETSRRLAEEVLEQAGPGGRVACVSSPSIFRACQVADNVDLFEFDKRFDAFGKYFFFYDYKEPESVPPECVGAYQVVIADPPFLSEECLEKVAITVNKIISPGGKILLCTGGIMEKKAQETMGLHRTEFIPEHKKKCLKNPFACFANYDCKLSNPVTNDKSSESSDKKCEN